MKKVKNVTNKVLRKHRGIFAHPQWLTAQDHIIMKRGVNA